MSAQLVTVPFHDDELLAGRGEKGEILVGLRRVCKVMGLGYESQLQKLKTRSWATVTQIVMVAEDGKERRLTVVDLKTLHGWLVNLNENKVAPDVRDKLKRYQAECVSVLEKHFSAPATSGDPLLDYIHTIHRTAGALVEMRQLQLAHEKEIHLVRNIAETADLKADHAGALATAAMESAGNHHGYLTVLGYCKLTRREVTEREAAGFGRQVSAICRERGIPIRRVVCERYGAVQSYPTSILREFFQDDDTPFDLG